MEALRTLISSRRFEWAITALIVVNAVTLGLETSETAQQSIGGFLYAADTILLCIFTAELLLRIIVHRWNFFKDPWCIFDFLVVGISWVPTTGGLSVLRALRILRVLRLISVVPSLRKVVGGLVAALPGMGSIVFLISLVFYVFSVMATKLFGAEFPEWFGNLGLSAYSLFQIMTLESWSMGIVRPVMERFPYAWAFFIPFIICTTFTVLNLFIGIIVSAMQSEHEDAATSEREKMQADQKIILSEMKHLRETLDKMSQRSRM